MGQRTELQSLFETLTSNVYFQPVPNVSMVYPCIIYSRDNMSAEFANNAPYQLETRYLVTVISRDPDDTLHKSVAKLPKCLYNRGYRANGLNHDVFNLYF